MQQSLGLSFSFLIYYGMPFHRQALNQIYAPFIKPGDLCFDIGAHLGDRIRALSQLDTRIVALEPQPECMSWLRHWYGSHPNIVLIEEAVCARPGTEIFWISRLNPTMSTLSRKWLTTIQQTPRFSKVHWDEQITVTVTTLDSLIAQHGKPTFCKIDVEGAELDVLKGLSQPLAALSFEYIPAMIGIAIGCIERLGQLGHYEYNWRVSEWPRLRSLLWMGPEEMIERLKSMPSNSDSGDVYARLVNG